MNLRKKLSSVDENDVACLCLWANPIVFNVQMRYQTKKLSLPVPPIPSRVVHPLCIACYIPGLHVGHVVQKNNKTSFDKSLKKQYLTHVKLTPIHDRVIVHSKFPQSKLQYRSWANWWVVWPPACTQMFRGSFFFPFASIQERVKKGDPDRAKVNIVDCINRQEKPIKTQGW